MKCSAHRSLPGYFVVIRGRTLAAKQIDTQCVSGGWTAGINRLPRYTHRAVPSVCRRIETRHDCESGIPGPAFFVVRLVQINIEVDPLPLRRDFEFFVLLDVGEVRSEKHFSNVPVPKLVSFLVTVRRRPEIQSFIGANKQEVEVFRGPTGADFGAIAGNYFPVRILVHGDAGRSAPELRSRIEMQRDILFRS